MRTNFLLIFILTGMLLSCKKSAPGNNCDLSKATAPASEVASLQAYITNNSITATQHSSGLFYTVTNPGSAITPTGCSAVTVKYVGRLTNGSVFDDSNLINANGITFALAQLISGWQIGIPVIQKGGTITLYIPPSLGYGGTASSMIPANSILIFNIELVNVQ